MRRERKKRERSGETRMLDVMCSPASQSDRFMGMTSLWPSELQGPPQKKKKKSKTQKKVESSVAVIALFHRRHTTDALRDYRRLVHTSLATVRIPGI